MFKKLTFSLLSSFYIFQFQGISQDYTFRYIGILNEEKAVKLSDSLKTPILISSSKVYLIGKGCSSKLIGGDIDDRNFDSDGNNRDDDGESNDRKKNKDSNERKNGGDTSDRKDKAKINQRDDDGAVNQRNKNGLNSERNRNSVVNDRNKEIQSAIGTRCSIVKGGKLILFTRENIKTKKTKIYHLGSFYSSKYFIIKQI